MKTVVDLYSTALNQSKEVNGEVVKLHYLEETANRGDGSRFLLEMEVELDDDKTVYTAEYVYLKSGSSQLCHTSNFQWTKNVDVYFIVTGKGLEMGMEGGVLLESERRGGKKIFFGREVGFFLKQTLLCYGSCFFFPFTSS